MAMILMRIDWYPLHPHPKVTLIAEELFSHTPVKTKGVNKLERDSKLNLICMQFISALYLNYHQADKNNPVTTYLSPKHFKYKNPVAGKLPYPHGAYLDVYNTLINLKWITQQLGEKGKSLTLIKPTEILRDKFDEIGFLWTEQPLKSDDQLLIMRDVKLDKSNKKVKHSVPVPDYPLRELHLSNLKKINKALLSHCFTLAVSDADLLKVNTKKPEGKNSTEDFDKTTMITNVQLSRIFARGSTELGGRFYRGWWQSIPSKHRPHIRIDGYKTDEVDFSGFGIRILYSMVGAQFKGEDPYDLKLKDWKGKNDPRRDEIKKAFNALINDVDGTFKLLPKQIILLGINTKELEERIKAIHKPIADLLRTKDGLRATYIDSTIAEHIMLTMINNDAITLPIHDSFIVRLKDKPLLQYAMNKACNKMLGFSIDTTEEYIKNAEHFNMLKEEVITLSSDPENMIVNAKELKDSILNKPQTIMEKYLASFKDYKAGLYNGN